MVKVDPRYSKTVLEDGTVMYTYPRSDGAGVHKRYYRPVPDSERKYKRHVEQPLSVLPDEARVMPATKPGGQRAANQERARRGWETRRARAASSQGRPGPRR